MRRGIKCLLIGIEIGSIGRMFGISPCGTSFKNSNRLQWLFTIRGAIEPSSSNDMIAINGFTGEKLGIPSLPRKWPRSIRAKFVDVMAQLGRLNY